MANAVRPLGLFRNLNAKIAAIPMVLTVIVVFVGCTLWTVIYSFTDSRLLPSSNFVGLAQYQRLWGTDRWNISIGNLATYGILSLVFAFVVGFFLAVLMDQKIRFENTFRTIFLYPFALSFIVTGLVWQWILDPALGLPKLMQDMGFTSFNFALLGNQKTVLYALVIAGLWQGTGLVMVLMLAGLRGIDGEIWKASRVDGIPAWRTYIFVVIPMMRGVFVTTLVIVASGIVRVYDLVVAMTSGGPGFASEMPAKYVYDFMFQRSNLGQALSASTVMLVTVFIFVVPWALIEFRQKRR
ncbi:carbohydrate ABC transporter membrane protein 1 (CUT1 family) [Rhizobium sp. ERR 922]|uniref:Sugar ABC transporter permease n=1 Tax=Rhizobium dioscoreae TaxID=2653122 RepID=A0ABQ0YZ67_9HYPH|nr:MULTISPECIES: sugar ABC transporter permease [Rhizobium]MCZ3378861.1 sugar ABC transporter permease [Rhizobium sp. AG207R]MDK4712144.1 sugar ABC transporter permease [Rhizobium sp. CNPSo 4039]TWB19320.1 carbohydrate ABC transporter membrane protein 1 (CUT1 family) [Rhizobium sp. ERR1071]TWB61873.1 carbohydrate ABC transporter membrane protein 1 (CUT1 family) [Rhizobium sp. ERR 922]TWC04799.1 carbohydrate ABC transporter membrane protein 1 (CUT1 family) [Rhizobium sp. ERR 942]